jgi:predicted chitinase
LGGFFFGASHDHSADAAGDAADLPARASVGAGRIRGEAIGLDAAVITHTRTRLTYFFANLEHESGGFTIPNLTENTRYTAERMVQVWPNRFPSAAAVRAKYGTADGWQLKAFDDIYGNRMGNRPGSHDGSTYIGRGEARR